jgi:hypothetical protein
MVHRNIADIEIPFFIWKKLVKKEKARPNLAFDTETIDGKVFLISTSNKNEYTNDETFKDLSGLLQWMNNKNYRSTVNWFYNLEYDTNAILKFLDRKDRLHIAEFNYVDHEDFRISLIPRKELKISKVKNDKLLHSTVFYDLAQFYNFKKLADLAETTPYSKVYVNDISAIDGDKYYNDKDYNTLLNERCYIDCKITIEKANELTNAVHKLTILNKWRSNASISRNYVLSNLAKNLKLPTPKLLDVALKTYHAGHIETNQIGLFSNVHNYDIKSAYPSFIANLYETSGGYLHNSEYEPDTAYSYYDIEIDYKNEYVSPLWFNIHGKNYHPNGKFNTKVTKTELEYLILEGCDFKILSAHHLTKDKYTEQPFYDIIHDLYNERLKCKDDESKQDIEKVIKIILNSIYGVTLNTIHKKVIADSFFETDLWSVIDGKMVFYTNEFKATNMYNPVYGCDTTAQTRSKLFTDFRNKFHKIISINTDGVYMTGTTNNIKISKNLGDYGYKNFDQIMVMGSGRYFTFSNNKIDNNESKFRGVSKKPKDIHDDMKKNKNKQCLRVKKDKPIKLKESLKNSNYYDFTIAKFPILDFNLVDQFNVFNKVEKDIYYKTNKRFWFDKINTIGDLWDKQIQSRPFNVSELE